MMGPIDDELTDDDAVKPVDRHDGDKGIPDQTADDEVESGGGYGNHALDTPA